MNTFKTLLDGELHFGDNAGYYKSATYIGLTLSLPCRADLNNLSASIIFRFETKEIQTWGGSKIGHPVTINQTEIGQLVDTDDVAGPTEIFDFTLTKSEFEAAIENNPKFRLTVNMSNAVPAGLLDDFILNRIRVKGGRVTLGWV